MAMVGIIFDYQRFEIKDVCIGQSIGNSEICGDGIVGAGEVCEIGDWRDYCEVTYGRPPYGNSWHNWIKQDCSNNCLSWVDLDTWDCEGYCGDLAKNGPEQCEPAGSTQTTADSLFNQYVCGLDCKWSTGGWCGDRVVQQCSDPQYNSDQIPCEGSGAIWFGEECDTYSLLEGPCSVENAAGDPTGVTGVWVRECKSDCTLEATRNCIPAGECQPDHKQNPDGICYPDHCTFISSYTDPFDLILTGACNAGSPRCPVGTQFCRLFKGSDVTHSRYDAYPASTQCDDVDSHAICRSCVMCEDDGWDTAWKPLGIGACFPDGSSCNYNLDCCSGNCVDSACESGVAMTYQCSDGADNDSDGYIDFQGGDPDPECDSDLDDDESGTGPTAGNNPPQVISFSILPGSVLVNWTVNVDQGLAEVQLYRTGDSGGAPDKNNWKQVKKKIISSTLKSGTLSGTLDDDPSAGTWWYGMHAVDQQGDFGVEPYQIKVFIDSTNTCVDSDRDNHYNKTKCQTHGDDCDDTDASINPTNNNCGGTPLPKPIVVCVDGDGDGYDGKTSACLAGTDCDDTKDYIYPGAPELCDRVDNQCPGDSGYGQIDEGCPPAQQTCADQGGDICATDEVCPGIALTAFDTTRCCDQTCVVPAWSNCNQCGSGFLNSCDRAECHSITEGCYFEPGLLGFVLSRCTPCTQISCSNYDDATDCNADKCRLGNCAWSGSSCQTAQSAGVNVDIDGSQEHQTIDGWGVTHHVVGNSGWDPYQSGFPIPEQNVMNQLKNDMGIDYVENFANLLMDTHENSNDDNDPFHYNWTSFNSQLSSLDYVFQRLQRQQNAGLKIGITSHGKPKWMYDSNDYIDTNNPDIYDEFAEYWAALLIYARNNYGINFDYISLQIEPSMIISGWMHFTPAQLRDAIKAVGARIRSEGFSTMISAPDDGTSVQSRIMCQTILQDPVATSYLPNIGFHAYDGGYPNGTADDAIAGIINLFQDPTVQNSGLSLWMTEWAHGTTDMEKMLEYSKMVYNTHVYGNATNYFLWASTPPPEGFWTGTVTGGKMDFQKYVHSFTQYSKYVRPGALRIGSSVSGAANIFVTAYKHIADNQLTIEAINMGATNETAMINLDNITATNLNVIRTSATENSANLGQVSVNGNSFTYTLPAESVTTFTDTMMAAAHPTVSCDQNAVQTAINNANDGDTIYVDSGSCTWLSGVSWPNKGITIQGAGIDQTTIIIGSANTMFSITGSSNNLRITGFTLDLNNRAGMNLAGISIAGDHHNFRIDHNKITNSGNQRPIRISGYCDGVIDHNEFYNNRFTDVTVFAGGNLTAGNASWNRPFNLGESDGVTFVEDNTFTYDFCATDGPAGHAMSSGNGGRYVFRYNTINACYDPGPPAHQVGAPIDVHGACFFNPNSDDDRGAVSYEIYGNTIESDTSYRGMFIRGGTGVIYDNRFVGNFAHEIDLTNYRSRVNNCVGNCGGCCDCSAGYPCLDQIKDLYIWNNTHGGNIVEPHVVSDSCVPTHIRENRDYFFRAPESGDNIYLYTPYTYPHPLTR